MVHINRWLTLITELWRYITKYIPWFMHTIRGLRCFEVVCCRSILPTSTVYPKKYAHGFCFSVLCCGYTLTDFPISTRLTSLALWQSNDCPSASKATLMNMDKYFMWIHYERLHNHNKAKHNKTVCIFLGIYCTLGVIWLVLLWLSCDCPIVNVIARTPMTKQSTSTNLLINRH